ncbi:cupin domain-containing protein [Pacificimonas flava]|uniref:Cupin type-2 domain-containing protein n=1 Tax=Pacificimonas flava TaxID=1234595 RepID=M2U346_9SPHN|nr:cupin domain-containing protein [Pacificimonas flava]EMD82407.1 hypothetical protein C725_2128 [Pacificimonas flava]MBB5281241.1 quercetin dioxygenase-like cupin family protein [Pacificimonas flava]
MAGPVRRIVTGHDADGRAIIQEDRLAPRVETMGGPRGATFTELWNVPAIPAPIDAASGEPPEDGIRLAPPPGGARIRIVDFPPEEVGAAEVTPEAARAHFAHVGAAEASRHHPGSRHPFMHRTETVDYGIVMEGEITLLLDVGETVVRAGDIVVQRGTNHGWANRSGAPCRICFVLIDGSFDDALKDA